MIFRLIGNAAFLAADAVGFLLIISEVCRIIAETMAGDEE